MLLQCCSKPTEGQAEASQKQMQAKTFQLRELFEDIIEFDFDKPGKDAQKRMLSGDFRVIAIRGFSLMFPGLSLEETEDEDNYRVIEGTSDDIDNSLHMRLIDLTTNYAETYNETVLKAREGPSAAAKRDFGDK